MNLDQNSVRWYSWIKAEYEFAGNQILTVGVPQSSLIIRILIWMVVPRNIVRKRINFIRGCLEMLHCEGIPLQISFGIGGKFFLILTCKDLKANVFSASLSGRLQFLEVLSSWRGEGFHREFITWDFVCNPIHLWCSKSAQDLGL